MRAAVPIAATGGLTIVYQRLDILMLSKLSTASEVAVYSVPYAVLQYSWVVPSAVAAAFFPVLTDALRRDAHRARYLFFLVVRLLFFFSVPAAIFLAAGSTPILTTLFGDKYAESGVVLAILAVVVVLAAQNYVLWYGIFAMKQEAMVVAIQSAGLGLNAVLNLFLIPRFGAEGAASALVASELVVTGGQAGLLHRRVFAIPWAEVLVRPLVASVAAGATILALVPVSSLAAAAGGAVACVLVLVVTRYVSWDEWAPLRGGVRVLISKVQPTSTRS
jgi:O-antigen/teichoic acid export membrane protein